MRHRRKFNHLSRTSAHRRAMLSNMATSLILHKRITTTVAKAKALRSYVEPLITRSKNDTTHSRRTAFSYLQSKEAVNELFREVTTKVAERPGGYTRIIKMGNRLGDNAELALIELVDYNENLLAAEKPAEEKTGRRRRRGRRGSGKGKSEDQQKQAPQETAQKKAKHKEEKAAPKDIATEEDGKAEEKTAEATAAPEEKNEEAPAAEKPEVKTETEPEAKTEAEAEPKEEEKTEEKQEEKKAEPKKESKPEAKKTEEDSAKKADKSEEEGEEKDEKKPE